MLCYKYAKEKDVYDYAKVKKVILLYYDNLCYLYINFYCYTHNF